MLSMMKLELSPEMQQFIEDEVKSGRYEHPEDVVLASLARMMQQEGLEGLSAQEVEVLYPGFRAKISEGLEDLRAGRVSDGEEFFDELDRQEDVAKGPDRKTA
jgi:antitoxin ParD1/3/4